MYWTFGKILVQPISLMMRITQIPLVKENGSSLKGPKGSLVLARCLKQNSLYVMHAMVSDGEVNVADRDVPIEFWHKRLGHMSQKGLEVLTRKNILPKIRGMHLETCVDCLAGRQHRVAFQHSPPKRKPQPLELVHTNLC